MMKEWTRRELEAAGYTIDNMHIGKPDLSMEDHGCLTLSLPMSGSGCGVVYGGICIGKWCISEQKEFEGSAKGIEYIMRIMDTIGVEKLNNLNGKYCRIATKGWGDTVKIIGHIIEDKWFDPEEFFKQDDIQKIQHEYVDKDDYSCETCLYKDKGEHEEPCKTCCHNYINHWRLDKMN